MQVRLIGFKGTLNIFKSVYDGNITLENVEKDQTKLRSDLGHMKQGNQKNKSEEQINVINNASNLCESREKVVQLFNNYAKNIYRNIYNSKQAAAGLKILTPKSFYDPKAFMEYSNDMQDVYKNIEDYNPIEKRKVLIIFDDMIADMININKLNPIVTELFIGGRKLNISIVFIT